MLWICHWNNLIILVIQFHLNHQNCTVQKHKNEITTTSSILSLCQDNVVCSMASYEKQVLYFFCIIRMNRCVCDILNWERTHTCIPHVLDKKIFCRTIVHHPPINLSFSLHCFTMCNYLKCCLNISSCDFSCCTSCIWQYVRIHHIHSISMSYTFIFVASLIFYWWLK